MTRRTKHVVLTLALLASAVAALAPVRGAAAQQEEARRRTPRKFLFALIGATIGGGAGATYAFTNGQQQPGNCARPACVLTVSVITGGLIGYMIGREFDELHDLRFRGGAPLYPKDVAVGLTGDVQVLAARNSEVAVGGSAGVQLFRSGAASLQPAQRRAAGVRGISSIDIAPRVGSLVLGSLSGLYLFPAGSGPGALLREREIASVAATGERIFLAAGSRVESAPLSADTTRDWPGVDVLAPVRDIQLDSMGVLWAATDNALISFRPTGDSLVEVGRAALPVGARQIAVGGGRLAVAMGEGGVRWFDVADAAGPREITNWTGTHFAYDVSIAGKRLFVAAGPEGTYVLDATSNPLRVIGLARDLGFAAAIISRDNFTYVLDRRTNSLRRIASDFMIR